MARRSVVEILIQAKDATAGAIASATGKLRALGARIFSVQTLVAGFATTIVTKWVGAIIRAFSEQEQAIIRLNAALAATGRFTEAGSKAVQEMADEMQRLTTVADEAALGVSSTVAQLARTLTPQQLADVQKAVIGLSSAMGLDLQSAAVLVGKALGGERDVLSRYGISLKEAGSEQERFTELMKKTAGFFDVARESATSFSGRVQQMRNAFDDLLETLGFTIVKVFRLDEVTIGAKDSFIEWNEALINSVGTWVRWGRVAVDSVRAIAVSLRSFLRFFSNFGQAVGHAFMVAINTVAGLVIDLLNKAVAEPMNNIVDGLELAARALGVNLDLSFFRIARADSSKFWQEASENAILFHKQIKDNEDAFNDLGEAWNRVREDIISKPVEFTMGRGGGGGGGGGGDTPDQKKAAEAADALTASVAALFDEFERGQMSFAEFQVRLGQIAPAMLTLRDSGTLADDKLKEFSKTLADVQQRASQIALDAPAQEADRLARSFDYQVARLDAGLITFAEFKAQLDIIGPAMLALRDSGLLTTEQLTAFLGKLEEIKTKAAEIAAAQDTGGSPAAPGFWQQVADALNGATESGEAFNQVIADTVSRGIVDFGNAIAGAFEAVVSGSESAGEAFKTAMLESIGAVARALGQLYIGKAAAEFAEALANPATAGPHLASAAKWLSAAALMFALAGTLKGAAGGGGGGGGGGSAGGEAERARQLERERGSVTIVLPNGFINTADPAQVDALADAIETASGRRVTIQQGL